MNSQKLKRKFIESTSSQSQKKLKHESTQTGESHDLPIDLPYIPIEIRYLIYKYLHPISKLIKPVCFKCKEPIRPIADKKTKQNCILCSEPFKNDISIITPCRHKFHFHCVDSLFELGHHRCIGYKNIYDFYGHKNLSHYSQWEYEYECISCRDKKRKAARKSYHLVKDYSEICRKFPILNSNIVLLNH